jgi:arsenical pump membrane protein
VVAAVVALGLDPPAARSAASQVWPSFVLVAGLLLIGLVADQDGLFAAAGRRLAAMAPNGPVLFAGSTVAIAAVTALLNLDTAVVFLTPVLVHAARSRGQGEGPLLIGVVLLANAGSLLLPGSNLTNLIVVGHLHLSGGQFLARMALPWVASVLITAGTVAVVERRSLRTPVRREADRPPVADPIPMVIGVGAAAVAMAAVLVLALTSPALPVAVVGVLAVGTRLVAGRVHTGQVCSVIGLPVLVGLFGIATALGTVGRAWSGPSTLLAHLDPVGTAALAAAATVVVNNLPAASLLAARVPPHPFALLVGLDIGPNLLFTGSLAWVLWRRTAIASGSDPPTVRAVLVGLASVPLAMAGALLLLAWTGSR